MVTYWVKTPQWLKKLFPGQLIWDIPVGDEPAVYLTFDDGPHPTATQFVLEQLKKFNALGTFFCVGNNVRLFPEIYAATLAAGHTTGNHTYDHVNGWHTANFAYLKNIAVAAGYIKSHNFRPPYGRIKLSQVRKLIHAKPGWKVYMWDVLSGDFDKNITPEQCTAHVLQNIKPGSIVVFHDSEKAWERMQYTLPIVLKHCQDQGWKIKALPQ